MIGIDFISFLILSIISIVVSGILHFAFKFYITTGWRSYLCKVGIGWVGAWLGSPVAGYWPHRFGFLSHGQVFIVPAILGCLFSLIFVVDFMKTCAAVCKKEG